VKHILIAEDDEPKLFRLKEWVGNFFPECVVLSRTSVTSTLTALRESIPDLLLLDMSLPTYEVGPGELGGRPQDFGGLAVMKFMEFERLFAPVIVVTQYETFPVAKSVSMTLQELAALASRDHPRLFRGLVYYNSVIAGWESELERAMTGALRES
jgi:CheY-like chemotaxis protein